MKTELKILVPFVERLCSVFNQQETYERSEIIYKIKMIKEEFELSTTEDQNLKGEFYLEDEHN